MSLKCSNTPKSKNIPGEGDQNVLIPPRCIPPNMIRRKPPFCCFTSCSIFSFFHKHLLSVNPILQEIQLFHDIFHSVVWNYWCVMPDPKSFFWTTATVVDAAEINPNNNKTLLANGVNTLFIDGKQSVINGLRKLRNPPFWLVIFLIVPFNKISYYLIFSKDSITLQYLLSNYLLALILNQ